MITGTVNRHLLPIVPVSVRREDNGWEQLQLLLDTGFNEDIALELELVNHHRLETRPKRQLLTSEYVSGIDVRRGLIPPLRVEAQLHGSPREASLRILEKHSFSGQLGTEMLRYRRVTVDVVKGGTVTVDSIPRDSGRGVSWRPFGKRKRERTFGENAEVYQAEYSEWTPRDMPWTSLQIQYGERDWHTVRVNIDTGFSGELSLPSSWISRLGVRLPNESRIETAKGLVPEQSGETEVIWRGQRRRVECSHWDDDVPPLIGMKLLQGHRITIDFEGPAGTDIPIEIKPIPEYGSFKGKFLRSLAERFHL